MSSRSPSRARSFSDFLTRVFCIRTQPRSPSAGRIHDLPESFRFPTRRTPVQISETTVTYRMLWHQIQVRGGVCLLPRLMSFHLSKKLRNHPLPLCCSRVQLL